MKGLKNIKLVMVFIIVIALFSLDYIIRPVSDRNDAQGNQTEDQQIENEEDGEEDTLGDDINNEDGGESNLIRIIPIAVIVLGFFSFNIINRTMRK